MISFIDDNKAEYGVELICRVLQIAPSTYYRAQDLERVALKSAHYAVSMTTFIWLRLNISGRTANAVTVRVKYGSR